MDLVDPDVALLVGRGGGQLALHGRGTQTVAVLHRVLLAGLARHGVLALPAVVVGVDEADVRVLVHRDSHFADGEALDVAAAGERGTGGLGRRPLDTLVVDGAGELGAAHGELLGAAAEAAAGHAVQPEASIVGDGTLGHFLALEVEARLLLVGTLVAGVVAGGHFLAVAPVACLSEGVSR